MKLRSFMRVAVALALLCIGLFYAGSVTAQVIDFGRLDACETMGTGTQRDGAPPKALIDDNEQHTVFFTILSPTQRPRFIGSRRMESKQQSYTAKCEGISNYRAIQN